MVNRPATGASSPKKSGRRRRKYKSRDSYIQAPAAPNMSNLSFAQGTGIGAYLQQAMQDASDKINPVNNDLLGLLTGTGKGGQPMVSNKNYLEAVTGPTKAKPQQVARPVVMMPKDSLAGASGGGMSSGQDAQSNSLDMLTELAMSMLTQPGASYDYESAMQQAAHGIRQAYAAEIGAIRSNNRAFRKDTKKARKQIEHLYNGLAKQMGREAVRADKQGQIDAQEQMGIAQQGTDALSQLNQQLIGDETSMLQNLGLQDAAPALVSPDYDRMGSQISDLTGEGTRAAQLANRMGDAQSRYMQRSQAGARFEGADQSASLIGQLQDYLRQNRDQIGILKGNRAKEVQASNASIQGQAAQMEADQNAQTWDQVMQLLDSVQGIEQSNFDNNLASSKFQWDQKMDKRGLRLDQRDQQLSQQKFLASQQDSADPMANYAPGIKDALSIISQSKDPGDQKAVNALMQMFGSNEFRKDKVNLGNGETAKLTVFEAMAMARKKGMSMGLQGRELNDFIMAAAASVG